MPPNRSYADACGTAHALDLIGERWALLIVRELVLGPKRYSDLHADLPGISTNVLATRLDHLEKAGVVVRRRLPAPAASTVYELTHWGAQLEPLICQIGRWGAASPFHDRTAALSVTSFVLSLRTNFDKAAAAGLRVSVELHVGDEVFVADIRNGRFRIERGAAGSPDVVLTGAPTQLAAFVYALAATDAAVDVGLAGDVSLAERFRAAFVLPPVMPGPGPGSLRGDPS